MSKANATIGLVTAVLGLVAAVLGLATQLGAFGDIRIPVLPSRDTSDTQLPDWDNQDTRLACSPATVEPSLSLSVGSGSSGTKLTITGHGFCPGKSVQIRFHTEQIATTQTDDKGTFSVPATVPGSYDAFAPQQFDIVASGQAGQADLPFRLTAR